MKKFRCACGLPLHYSDKAKEAEIAKLCEELGEWQPVNVGEERYLVQRHYIALHGLTSNLEPLVLNGIARRNRK